jgi:uncharacterized protein YraI
MPTIPHGALAGRCCRAFASLTTLLVLLSLAPVGALAQESQPSAPELQVGASAVVAFTDGDGALLRAAPGYDAETLALLPEGQSVDLLDGPLTAADGSSWYQVATPAGDGYVDAQFFAAAPAGVDAEGVDGAAATTEPPIADEATIAATAGDSLVATTDLNLRAGPSTTDAVVTVMPPGAAVTATGADSSGFTPVTYNGVAGWAFAGFLQPAGSAPPADGSTPGGGSATTTSDLNLRAGPSTADAVLAVMPPGAPVTLTGEESNGFLGISYNGTAGWAFAEFLQTSGTPPSTDPGPTPGDGPGGTATVTSSLNLRAGPSTGDAVLTVMPAGAAVALTGDAANGFLAVSYGGRTGWAFATYLQTSGGTPPPASDPGTGMGATTTTDLNLRAGPSTADAILLVMPAGSAVQTTGPAQAGFYPVTYAGNTGWASGSFLSFGGAPPPPGEEPPPAGGSGIVWPFSGGPWTVIQGYNAGTHSGTQYQYSLDLALAQGETAGQTILSPVSGTIRWVDRGSGGMLIDIGNGYSLAFFHVTVGGGFATGQQVAQGQVLGSISPPGGDGYAVTPHIDLTLWRTDGGGRVSAPFSGQNAISGRDFPDIGGFNQYLGTEINP